MASTEAKKDLDEIYSTLLKRSEGGRTGESLTLSDYAGLFGLVGRRYVSQARDALARAGIPFDAADSCDFIRVIEK